MFEIFYNKKLFKNTLKEKEIIKRKFKGIVKKELKIQRVQAVFRFISAGLLQLVQTIS